MAIYRMADLNIEIRHRYRYTAGLCRRYRVPDETVPDFTVEPDPNDYAKDKAACPQFPDGYLEGLSVYRAIADAILDYHGFLMHASVVERNGKAYAFAAKSGTGKTTHCRLWLERFDDARIINGDKPLIRFFDGIPYIYGTPWCGNENYEVNTRSPLSGLCFIERGEHNHIERLDKAAAVQRIFTQLLLPKKTERLNTLLDYVGEMIDVVPCFVLSCNMDPEAAEVSCEALSKAAEEIRYGQV